MSKHKYVIMDKLFTGNFLGWGGSFKSNEYPDAVKFDSSREAVKQARKVADAAQTVTYVIEDYGEDTQSEFTKIFPDRKA